MKSLPRLHSRADEAVTRTRCTGDRPGPCRRRDSMILIFDSHPVQYKAPVYQCLQKMRPDAFRVIYASDCSVRGHQDREFGTRVSWDVPLLAGYPSWGWIN